MAYNDDNKRREYITRMERRNFTISFTPAKDPCLSKVMGNKKKDIGPRFKGAMLHDITEELLDVFPRKHHLESSKETRKKLIQLMAADFDKMPNVPSKGKRPSPPIFSSLLTREEKTACAWVGRHENPEASLLTLVNESGSLFQKQVKPTESHQESLFPDLA